MSASADDFDWDPDLGSRDATSSILPPPPEERVDLEQVLREHAGEVPSLAITIRPEDLTAVSAAPSVRPAQPSRQRGLQAVIAISAGIAAGAIVGSFDREESVTTEPAVPARATEVSDIGALAPASTDVVAAPRVSDPVAVEPRVTAPAQPAATAAARVSEGASRRAERIAPTAPAATPSVPPAPSVEPPAPAPAPAATELSREDVRRVMESLRTSLLTCADGANGRLLLQLVVHPSGRVQSSLVEGAFVGRSQGSCMARTGRAARFPAFAATEPATVRYPYSL